MQLEILYIFIYLLVVGIGSTILWLHIEFWEDVGHPLFAFLTLPFCPIIALIDLIIIIKDNIKYKHSQKFF